MLQSLYFVFFMDNREFLDSLIPGNYFITKSMELTKSRTSGTLWYTKKFIVLYYYIFLNGNINTLATAKEICDIFDEYINSLPETLRGKARNYFYASHKVADLRDADFKLFGEFAGTKQFFSDAERIAHFEGAKKYYFAFLMGSGGQRGVNSWIKDCLYTADFSYDKIDDVIIEWAEANCNNPDDFNKWLKKYEKGEQSIAVAGMRNDYMAFVRNERQILFYYGFFHSKSIGSNDREFSSLTPIGELALHSNYYELIAIWEHQKLKMLSQPVNIEIRGLADSVISSTDKFAVNLNPYLTILQSLKNSLGFSKDAYQYVVSRLSEYPTDGVDVSEQFIETVRRKVEGFNRKADVNNEDFRKELLKYILGVRSDLATDNQLNPIGICKWDNKSLSITNTKQLERLIAIYATLCKYKVGKYNELFQSCTDELKRQYKLSAAGKPYTLNPKIKIDWDMYNIHSDILILLSSSILILEAKTGLAFTRDSIENFADGLKDVFPNILRILGVTSKMALKRELRNILDVFGKGDYAIYLENNADDYQMSVASYLDESLADIEQKIKDYSAMSSVYVDGVRKRNLVLISLIKSYNLQKYAANGQLLRCECCGNSTFLTYKKESYVEYHHIIPFSEYDGPDHSLNIIALCPMCHRKLHYLRQDDKRELYGSIETNSYNNLSIEKRLVELYNEQRLKSYQLEFLLADNAIDESAYNRILQIA